ncbi:glycosyltransferase family 2 protein [Dyadobacter luticola]|uniref:Glycosyltransferase family 2 protein n=1 Tax=Dyadobacter luticola TaxID=1979387 RepID=A0A5R9L4G4_9BACT|nr:glycosyltransferase family 2 protein [Dyadobacter luticola]TLV03301.1 glycosyltransferase family 2 protein [Dyadobacter luticola]
MKSTPRISIAMCTYNGRDFLQQQLDSILAQTVSDWEMVIVDDCSADDTHAILNAYAERDPRFKIHCNDQNLGYNKNFEKALQLCECDIIAICDQDDIWRPDKLETQLNALGDHQLIYHDSEFIEDSGKPMGIKISDKFNFYRGSNPEAFLYLNCVSGHSIMMKKPVLEKALPFPANFHYDQWLAFISATEGSINFVDQCLVKYRQHQKNNTDMLALHAVARNVDQKLEGLEQESAWLLLCLGKAKGKSKLLIDRLYTLSLQRNKSFASIAYGITIWKNRQSLLYLLKKSEVSKFFYTLRKIWGSRIKKRI